MLLNEISGRIYTVYRVEDANTTKGPFASYHEDGNHDQEKRWAWRTIDSALDFFDSDFDGQVYPLTLSGFTLVEYRVTKIFPTEEGIDAECIFYLPDVISRNIIPKNRYLKKKYQYHDRTDPTRLRQFQQMNLDIRRTGF